MSREVENIITRQPEETGATDDLRVNTSSGIGFRLSFMYPTEGGISPLLFPERKRWVLFQHIIDAAFKQT